MKDYLNVFIEAIFLKQLLVKWLVEHRFGSIEGEWAIFKGKLYKGVFSSIHCT